MSSKLFLPAFFLLSLFASCGSNDIRQHASVTPHDTIFLQPYNNFTQKEAEQIKLELSKRLPKILPDTFVIKVMPNKQLSEILMNDAKTRYRADKIINSLKGKTPTVIALTHHDVSITYKGKKDWGVLGLAFRKKVRCNACVASDFRLKHKQRDLWKVVTHEFIHTYYGYGHCPKDSTNCLMKDARGKADFSNKHDLCGFCKSKIG